MFLLISIYCALMFLSVVAGGYVLALAILSKFSE